MKLQQFYLHRKTDVSGISGTGVIAHGVILPSGSVVMEWVTTHGSIAIYKSINEIQAVHGHNGQTEIIYVD